MKKSDSKIFKVVKVFGNVFFYTLIVFLLLFSIANMQIKSKDDIANIFGTGFLPVLSDSMEGSKNDSFNKGDLLFVKLFNQDDTSKLVVGVIVTFYDPTIDALNTHRIVEVSNTFVVTQGDKAYNLAPYITGENNNGKDYQVVTISNIKAIHTGSLANVGSAITYLQTGTGFALFVILPVVLLLAYQGFVLTKTLLAVNKEKIEAKHAVDKESLLEAEKDRIRKELLEELKKEQSKE